MFSTFKNDQEHICRISNSKLQPILCQFYLSVGLNIYLENVDSLLIVSKTWLSVWNLKVRAVKVQNCMLYE